MTERISRINRWHGLDRVFLITTLGLVTVGMLLINSADHAQGGSGHFEKQVFFLIIGLTAMGTAALVPMRVYHALAYIAFGATLLVLMAVPFIGDVSLGARRWIVLGGINFQPAEPAKLAFILAASRLLSQYRPEEAPWKKVLTVATLGAVPTLLVLAQPDLGTASVFPIIGLILLAWSGLPLWYFLIAILPFLSFFIALVPWLVLPVILFIFWMMWRSGMRWKGLAILGVICVVASFAAPYAWNRLAPYQQKRLTTFLEPAEDPLGAGYQVIQSKVAIGSGGLVGSGYLKGTQTQLRFLPQQHTDFIFALAGEEFGLIGTTVSLLLFFSFGWRGVRTASRARSQFAGLVAIGITSMIIYHTAINIGMAVGMLPVTGIPLPYLSYGGSFLITCLFNAGVVISVGLYRRE
jgi:rod shape determining protein RodA